MGELLLPLVSYTKKGKLECLDESNNYDLYIMWQHIV